MPRSCRINTTFSGDDFGWKGQPGSVGNILRRCKDWNSPVSQERSRGNKNGSLKTHAHTDWHPHRVQGLWKSQNHKTAYVLQLQDTYWKSPFSPRPTCRHEIVEPWPYTHQNIHHANKATKVPFHMGKTTTWDVRGYLRHKSSVSDHMPTIMSRCDRGNEGCLATGNRISNTYCHICGHIRNMWARKRHRMTICPK